jgi:hypothetical protein
MGALPPPGLESLVGLELVVLQPEWAALVPLGLESLAVLFRAA